MTRARKASLELRTSMITLPRLAKRALLIVNDFILLSLALWLSYSSRLSELYIPADLDTALIFFAAPVIGIITFYFRGLYRLVTRYLHQEAAPHIYLTVIIAVLIWALLLFMVGGSGVPRSVVVIYALFAAALIRLSRHFAGWVLQAMPKARTASFDPRKKVAIYGAGNTGLQLLRSLRANEFYKPVAFIDDDPSLIGQIIQGLKVHAPGKIEGLIGRHLLREIFIAMPSVSRQRRSAVLRALERYPLIVKTLPALADIASGRVQVSDLRPIEVEDLLGRDPVTPDPQLLTQDIKGKSVMVTGAGGSIGSELTRQIVRLSPRRLVLYELSETALYEIEMEVLATLQAIHKQSSLPRPEIIAILGSVLDQPLLSRVLQAHDVETIYHAAAYKHVPIVEINPAAGILNNSFGTLAVAEVAAALDVKRVVLISTDKAVRPTSIMGASKRLAELILQGYAAEHPNGTVFTMVRFGNVLDSSGSVVRLFRKQIESGGPVTVTHPQMIRYFMSIPEAAQLVIQAGAMASGGEVFVLDMGAPVRIDDLARTMIRLSGLEILDEDNPHGDIAIEYVGLRQGEKLYEELLIGENTAGTKHPRIMKNSEPHLSLAELRGELEVLRGAADVNDLDAMHAVLRRVVEGYVEQSAATMIDEPAKPSIPRTLH